MDRSLFIQDGVKQTDVRNRNVADQKDNVLDIIVEETWLRNHILQDIAEVPHVPSMNAAKLDNDAAIETVAMDGS